MKGKKKIAASSKKPETKKLYFGPEVQNSIEQYNLNSDSQEKEEIYKKEILPAFDKLVENLIRIYGFVKGTDIIFEVKSDCVCFLYENLKKFNPDKGTKAFSYFNVVARNWLILNSKKRMKEEIRIISVDDILRLSAVDKMQIAHHSIIHSPEDIIIDNDKKNRILDVISKIETKLFVEHEKSVIAALRVVFENIDNIDLLSKRAVFLYVREIANVNQKQLLSSMSVIKRHYREITKETGDLI